MPLLPEFESYISQDQKIEQIIITAQKQWESRFDPTVFSANLDAYVALLNNPDAQNQQQFNQLLKYFKGVRKAGQMLRTVFSFFDEMHEVPEEFDRFITDLGQLKDHFGLEDSKNFAGTVRIILAQNPSLGLNGLKVASHRAVMDVAHSNVRRAELILKEEKNEGHIVVERLHKLRKRLRTFAHLLTLAREEDSSNEVILLQALLNQIDDDLGSIHDEVVRKVIYDKVNYDEEQVTLPEHLRQSIRNLLSGTN